MKAVILCGGRGTRLREETEYRPKPMVEIGGRPILWHIMKLFDYHGVTEFILCLGYKGHIIKDFFVNYCLHLSDVTVDLATQQTIVHQSRAEQWRVTLVDTGNDTMTGGRLKRIRQYIDGKPFLMTYGDGLGDIDVSDTIAFHAKHGRAATVTATRAPGRFGALRLNGAAVEHMVEKPEGEAGWINGGFFVLEPRCLDYVKDDTTIWEREPMECLSRTGELMAYRHSGFWQPMDTLREREQLEELWKMGRAPWKIWRE